MKVHLTTILSQSHFKVDNFTFMQLCMKISKQSLLSSNHFSFYLLFIKICTQNSSKTVGSKGTKTVQFNAAEK